MRNVYKKIPFKAKIYKELNYLPLKDSLEILQPTILRETPLTWSHKENSSASLTIKQLEKIKIIKTQNTPEVLANSIHNK